MNVDTWMPYYGQDFEGAMKGYSAEVKWAYIAALWHYWHHTHALGLPDDNEYLRNVCEAPETSWARIMGIVFSARPMFYLESGKWHQDRARGEYKDAVERREKLNEASKLGIRRRLELGQIKQPSVEPSVQPSDTQKGNRRLTSSPSPSPSPSLINLSKGNLKMKGASKTFQALKLANRIVSNQDGWAYDNCKLQPEHLKPASLAKVLEEYAGGEEDYILAQWCRAATETHKAMVDGMVKGSPAQYVIGCFRARMNV